MGRAAGTNLGSYSVKENMMRNLEPRHGELGTYIKERRDALRETVTSLATKAQVGIGSLSEIERGLRTPRHATLRKLSGPLGIDPNELFVRAFFTQELRPTAAYPALPENRITFICEVTHEEYRALEEYRLFLRFRGVHGQSAMSPEAAHYANVEGVIPKVASEK